MSQKLRKKRESRERRQRAARELERQGVATRIDDTPDTQPAPAVGDTSEAPNAWLLSKVEQLQDRVETLEDLDNRTSVLLMQVRKDLDNALGRVTVLELAAEQEAERAAEQAGKVGGK